MPTSWKTTDIAFARSRRAASSPRWPAPGVAGFSGDGGPSLAASLRFPYGSMAIDANGTLFFTDTYNHRVRSISLGQTARADDERDARLRSPLRATSGGAATTGVPGHRERFEFRTALPGLHGDYRGGNWLQTDVSSGTSPATVNVSANPAGLAAGNLSGHGARDFALRQSDHRQHCGDVHREGRVFRQTAGGFQRAVL